jgi:dTDP-6-deoxy-L-talose 4-dehydrogenase (NAD+)
MKIAVIGGTGFLGSNILKFIPKNYLITATYTNKKKINKKLSKKIIWKYLDIYKKKNFFKYLNKPDIVIHLSWSKLPNYNLKFHLTKELIKQKKFILDLIKGGLKNIFIAGTCFEYGKKNGKITENASEYPLSNYALAKFLLKKYVFLLSKKFNFNLIWGRIFYVYGKHNSRLTLYNQILDSSKRNLEITINGKLVRDYLHVNRISKIIVDLSLKRKNFGLVNISSGKGVSLKKLVNNICKTEKIKPNIKYVKIHRNNFESNIFWGCNKKLKKCLAE